MEIIRHATLAANAGTTITAPAQYVAPTYEDLENLDFIWGYRQTSNMSPTKSQNLNVSRLVLQLSLPNPLNPGIKSRMNM